MLKVYVKRDDPNGLEKALRKFKKICLETEKEVKKHEYYLRPGLRKIQKSKDAEQRRFQELKKIRKENYGKQKINKRTTNKD